MSAAEAYERWQPGGYNTAWVFRLSAWCCSLLPRLALYVLSDAVMDWFQRHHPEVADAVARNLACCFPERPRAEVERLASRTFENYGRGYVDYFLAPSHPPRVVQREGADRIIASLRGGAILVTAHMGNWEVGGAFLGECVGPHTIVGLPERDAGVESFRRSRRDASGHAMLTVGMGVPGMLQLRRGLEAGERMVVLVDRAVGRDAIEVTFRGRPANFLKSPAVFSLLTGVPLVPVAVFCDAPGEYSAFVGEPFTAAQCGGDLRRTMQRVADFLSGLMERYPDQWYNFFRYWREEP